MLGIRAEVRERRERTSRHVSDSPWRLGGRFDLLGPLGTGAAGTVWRGREVADGTEHAVKLLRPELVADGAAVAQLYATLNAVARLAHPGIAAVDDAVSADGWLALRSRLILGESLRTRLSRQGGMPPAHAAGLIVHVCDTLAAAHAAGIAHGDLHPANVLLGSPTSTSTSASSSLSAPVSGATAAPTAVLPTVNPLIAPGETALTDFGMAALINSAAARGVTATGAGLAAPPAEYRAPEIGPASPAQSDSAPADVYAAGILLYECLAGRAPFIAQWPEAVAQMHRQSPPPPITGVTDSLWRIVAACLEKDPRYRPTAAQLATALRSEAAAASNAVPPPAAPVTPAPPPAPAPATAAMPPPPATSAPTSGVAQTMMFDSFRDVSEPASDIARARDTSPGAGRLPRVISDHKTESGIAAAVVVAGLLIGAALSMGAGNSGSPNAAAAGQATSAPAIATTSAAPQAVVLPSASPSPSPSFSASPSPSASASATGDMVFVNVRSNKCMDTNGRVFADGTTEDIYDCNGTPAQAWNVTATGQFTEDGGAFCLDDLGFGNTPGTKVALWTCNGGTNQQWTIRTDGSIISNSANLCIDVTNQATDDYTPLVLESCNGSPSQQWTHQ